MKLAYAALALLALLPSTSAIVIQVRNASHNVTSAATNASQITHQAPSFSSYYNTHTGRGVWKWSHYLDVYDRHVSYFVGKPTAILEIGVQSGGSVQMWETVLGAQCHYYGMDVNKNCVQFQDAATTIFIGDQASVPTWNHFFTAVTPELDIIIDDGGHQAHQMLTTLQMTLPHLKAGGFHTTEDIHGVNDNYLAKFLTPAADQIGYFHATTAKVESVHIYPFIMAVQLVGRPAVALPAPTAHVSTIPELLAALPHHPGGCISLANPAWGSFLTADALKNFFSTFYEMYTGVVTQKPVECHDGQADQCDMIVTNTNQQNLVKGVHITANQALVELHATPPYIVAHRKGTVWIAYNGP